MQTLVAKEKTTEPVPLLLTSDFEAGTLGGWNRETCCGYSVQIVKSPSRSGKYAARFELKRGDPSVQKSKRTELVQKPIPANSERWYGFSLMLPSDWQTESSFEIVTQWPSVPDFDLKEDWRTPSLYLSTRNKVWRITNRWDPKRRTRGNDPSPEGGKATLWEGPYQQGIWTDWVVHVKWSSKSDGVLQVWKDGRLVVNKTGPNTYNDQQGPYFKMGIYKPDWRYDPKRSSTKTRVLYVDEVRIGDHRARYAAVAPPANSYK
ncbi:MAG: polysaccharide lyase [Phormidesmis sp. CAN_BIN44]|nr:polysaccharide lyase [Phormidesmis sp. CAN_BIN44]